MVGEKDRTWGGGSAGRETDDVSPPRANGIRRISTEGPGSRRIRNRLPEDARTGGTRIEIKGVSSLRAIPRLTHNEALRQRTLVGIKSELAKRGVAADTISDKGYDVTEVEF